MINYSREQLNNLYHDLPADLKKAVFSEEIGAVIHRACIKRQVNAGDQTLGVVKSVGYVFLGLLSPFKLVQFLEDNFSISKEIAENVSDDLIAEIFLPLRKNLDAMYGIKITAPKRPSDQYREKVK